MKILVIGGSGFVGRPTVHLLLQQGHDVTVLDRGKTPAALPTGARRVHADRNDPAALRAWLAQVKPAVVLDVIPFTEQQVQGLMEAARDIVRRVVALSSADVYRNYDGLRGKGTAPPDPVPLHEEAPLRETRYPYRGENLPFAWADDYDKILVERALLGAPNLPGTVLRLPMIYGPGDRQHRLRPYVQPMVHGDTMVRLAQEQAGWRWSRAFVENVAAAIALAVTDARAAGRIYNVGEEPAVTEAAWAAEIAAAAGWNGEIEAVPAVELPEEEQSSLDWRYELALDTGRIRRELGYTEPVSRSEALQRTIAWERTQLAGVHST